MAIKFFVFLSIDTQSFHAIDVALLCMKFLAENEAAMFILHVIFHHRLKTLCSFILPLPFLGKRRLYYLHALAMCTFLNCIDFTAPRVNFILKKKGKKKKHCHNAITLAGDFVNVLEHLAYYSTSYLLWCTLSLTFSVTLSLFPHFCMHSQTHIRRVSSANMKNHQILSSQCNETLTERN